MAAAAASVTDDARTKPTDRRIVADYRGPSRCSFTSSLQSQSRGGMISIPRWQFNSIKLVWALLKLLTEITPSKIISRICS